jgi:hypothetical protein
VLYQAGNIRIIFQDAYALTQMALPEVPARQEAVPNPLKW